MSPFACTLTAVEMPQRLAQVAALGRSLLSAESEAGRAILRFRADADTRSRLAAFVAAERGCCPSLRVELREEPDALTLVVAAPTD